MQKKTVFTVEQLSFISKLVTWGSIAGGFLLWLCTPWSVPIYHTGMRYYEGSKLPLLLIVALPFLIFIQRKPEIELHSDSLESIEIGQLEMRKWLSIRIILASFIAFWVIAILSVVLIISR